jgi:type IV fimbrial biogenesis protein FimT
MDSQCTRSKGFTLIEVLVTVAIAGILAAVAVPSFVRLIADQRAKAAATNLFTALSVTRSEAIKQNQNVKLLPKSDWANGWFIANPVTDADLGLLDANATGVPVTGGPASVIYNGGGRLAGTAAPSFTIGESGMPQRCLSVDLSGRPHIKASAC